MRLNRFLKRRTPEHMLPETIAWHYSVLFMGFAPVKFTRLQISDIDLRSKCIYIHRLKGFSTTHPLLNKEIQALKNWLDIRKTYPHADSEWLFLSRKGNPLSRQQFYQIISSSGGTAGLTIEIHPHMLRHSCGFALANMGIDTRLIQDYLGHRNIRHTVWYTASNAGRFLRHLGQYKWEKQRNSILQWRSGRQKGVDAWYSRWR